MAIHRMFSQRITDKAAFLRMSPSARLLYYDLGMKADDDGFVEAYTVMRTTGAAEDDLRVLAAKGFVRVINDDLLSWISDWTENNSIRKDRYRPSIYNDLLVRLTSGCPDNNQAVTECQPGDAQVDDPWLPQDRIGKDRESKDKRESEKRPRFSPPTPQEVEDYALVQGYQGFDSTRFCDYYTANGWRVGRNPMKDWKAAVRSWHNRDKPTTAQAGPKEYREFDPATDW